jgi:hypothetical protein
LLLLRRLQFLEGWRWGSHTPGGWAGVAGRPRVDVHWAGGGPLVSRQWRPLEAVAHCAERRGGGFFYIDGLKNFRLKGTVSRDLSTRFVI